MKSYKEYIKLNESKLNGKYGFFMFLDIIDEMKNSFIKEDYLNVRNFNIFFTTDNIKDKNKLTDLLKYKRSVDVAYATIQHIRNLRLSFYFGVRDFVLEYGFHDDLKRMVYKVGEFKITSKFLNSLLSYKSITLISRILSNVKLKDLNLLQDVKNDIKYLFDVKFNDIKINHEDKVVKKINNLELKNYYDNDNLSDYFDSWSFKHKWYYSTYNYIDIDDDYTYFYVKIKNKDEYLNLLKRKTDIKNLKKIEENNVDDGNFSDVIPRTTVAEPMITEPLNAPKLKVTKKDNGEKMNSIEKQKELIRYFKSLKRIIISVNKDMIKNKSYLSKHLYKVVGEYKKPFNDVKKDLQWLVYKLRDDRYFIEKQEEELSKKIEKKKKVKTKKLKKK